MSDIWRRDEPDSPCQAVCLIDPAARLCIGCQRTPEEIARWSAMTPEERARVREELPDRRGRLRNRRGGRTGRLARRETDQS